MIVRSATLVGGKFSLDLTPWRPPAAAEGLAEQRGLHLEEQRRAADASLNTGRAQVKPLTLSGSDVNQTLKLFIQRLHVSFFGGFYAGVFFAMNQTAGATNAYRRCSKGGKVREKLCLGFGAALVRAQAQCSSRWKRGTEPFLNQLVDCGG